MSRTRTIGRQGLRATIARGAGVLLAAVIAGLSAEARSAKAGATGLSAGAQRAKVEAQSAKADAAPAAQAAKAAVTTEPPTSGGPTSFRRLSEGQYVRAIADIFGADIKVPGRFEPRLREDGLLAIGDGKVVVSPTGVDQHELRAREISAQVLAEGRRQKVLSCTPPSPAAFDQACASTFLRTHGRRLYRRPLSDEELASALSAASAETQRWGSFFRGLEYGLARLLASPNFLFRVERTEPDPGRTDLQRLDAYALASRISFLLWDAPPDAALLDAAANGELRTRAGLARQVDRLIASPKFQDGVRAFFSDMFAFDQFEGLAKDQAIYEKYTSQLSKDAEEQTLRTIVDLLVTNKGDYRDLFTTKKTFMNRSLGAVYKVTVDEPGLDDWAPHTFGPSEPRGGILTLAAFLMLDPTHEGRTSPTIRGKSLRELFLCQKIPDPPNNVDFTQFQDPKNPKATVRERLEVHRKNPTCAGCHAMTDPIGLAMENYDGIGTYRTTENGVPIDASVTFERKPYKNILELTKSLRDNPALTSCVARRVYEYGTGGPVAQSERAWLTYLQQQFASNKYVFPALMKAVATSKAFQTVSASTVAAK